MNSLAGADKVIVRVWRRARIAWQVVLDASLWRCVPWADVGRKLCKRLVEGVECCFARLGSEALVVEVRDNIDED